jgi:hypothetical protein
MILLKFGKRTDLQILCINFLEINHQKSEYLESFQFVFISFEIF